MANLRMGEWLAEVDADASAPRTITVDVAQRRLVASPHVSLGEILNAIAFENGEPPAGGPLRVPILGRVS